MKTLTTLALLATPLLALAAPDAPDELTPHALTRAEVKEDLRLARISGRLSPGGEIADPPEVLRAREDFNALQAEVFRRDEAERGELAERD
jgi:hypothetical protein